MAPWNLPRRLAWGSRELKVWSRPGQVAESWGQSPARGRRTSVAAPENREKTRSLARPGCAPLPPIARSRQPPGAPGGRRDSLPGPGTGASGGPGKENLPLLGSPEKGRKTGALSRSAVRKVRRSSEEGAERAQPAAGKAAARCPDRQVLGGRKVQSESMSEGDWESASSADEEEFTNERIIDWLIGVNACLYRDPSLGHWNTLTSSEQDTSIKITHKED